MMLMGAWTVVKNGCECNRFFSSPPLEEYPKGEVVRVFVIYFIFSNHPAQFH